MYADLVVPFVGFMELSRCNQFQSLISSDEKKQSSPSLTPGSQPTYLNLDVTFTPVALGLGDLPAQTCDVSLSRLILSRIAHSAATFVSSCPMGNSVDLTLDIVATPGKTSILHENPKQYVSQCEFISASPFDICVDGRVLSDMCRVRVSQALLVNERFETFPLTFPVMSFFPLPRD